MGWLTVFLAVVSMISSGENQRDQAEYEEKVADNNADVAEYEAVEAKKASALKVGRHRQRVAELVGKQRAAMGATGVTVDEGTFLDLTKDTVSQGKMDELALLHEGDLDVWRAEMSKLGYQNQARMYGAAAPSNTGIAANALMTGAQSGLGYYSTFKTMK